MGSARFTLIGVDSKHRERSNHVVEIYHVSKNPENTKTEKTIRIPEKAIDELRGTDVKIYNNRPDTPLECFPYVSF